MKMLGVDFGTKYIGVAVGDEGICVPVKTLAAKPEDRLLKDLSKLAAEEAAHGFVVGLPINMNGSEGKAAKACREFAKRLADAAKLPVEFGDERLSSWEAEGMLIESGLKPSERKQRVHAVAAKLILEAFFAARKGLNGAGSQADEE